MAISDSDRRAAAQRMRKQLEYMRDHKGWYEYDLDALECGNTAYRNIAAAVEESGNLVSGNYIRIVERLADLVDRPTCRNIGGEEGTNGEHYDFFCTACGYAASVTEPNYCPNCGAEVVHE